MSDPKIDPQDLEIALRVLREAAPLPADDPQYVAIQRAFSGFYKSVKRARRKAKRDRIAAADRAVVAATATGSPRRIDDETAGIELASNAGGATAGTLIVARGCYICKTKYTVVDAFYHQLCPECAALNHKKRAARTDLRDRRALLTGGRAKIGMYIALRLLRDGAELTITTRFPRDAARRFGAMPDSEEWIERLRIVGIDLRDPAQVVALADSVAARGHLDIIINNAAQTVRRTDGAYAPLVAAEGVALPADRPLPELDRFGTTSDAHPAQLAGSAGELTRQALEAGSADLSRIDAGGLLPDVVNTNSWIQNLGEIDALELLEVQLCNQTAPFILIGRLRGALAASRARRTYVVNVSAMEGQFGGRRYKGPGHPHTNMSKAALNMLTRTSAEEMFMSDSILMTAVDTGWITDERPYTTKCASPPRALKRRWTSSMAPPACMTRSCAARPAKTSMACF